MTDITTARADFAAAIATARSRKAAFAALHALANALVPARLFTVTLFDRAAGVVRRSYSSHEDVYPTGGTKPLGADDWLRPEGGDWPMFMSNDIAAEKAQFPDFDLIVSLGCRAAVNLPVVLGDEVVATVNLLDAPGAYTPAAMRLITDELRPAAMLATAAARLAPG